jgi:LL-diaminopimelate aminotransferase
MLDFGIGENDEMAPANVRAVMKKEVDRPENRGYADNGIAAFKEAAAAFMQREFGVALDPVTEVNHCIGSKTAYAMLPAAFIDPGDVTLMTVPGYPVAGTATRWYGGVVHRLPLVAENDFFPDLDGIPADVLAKTKMLVLCYPNSPTGKTATREFYKRVVDFAHRHRVVVVQDAAHKGRRHPQQGEAQRNGQESGREEPWHVTSLALSKGLGANRFFQGASPAVKSPHRLPPLRESAA